MKVYYFNDTKSMQGVHIDNFYNIPKYLQPGSGESFEVPLKENQILFIKVWENGMVLLSGMDIKD